MKSWNDTKEWTCIHTPQHTPFMITSPLLVQSPVSFCSTINTNTLTLYLCEKSISSIQYCLFLSVTNWLLYCLNQTLKLYLSDVFHSLITNLFYVLCFVLVLYFQLCFLTASSFSDVQLCNSFHFWTKFWPPFLFCWPWITIDLE